MSIRFIASGVNVQRKYINFSWQYIKLKKDNTDTIIHVLMLPYNQNNLMGQTGMLFRGKAQSIDYRSSPLFEKENKEHLLLFH